MREAAAGGGGPKTLRLPAALCRASGGEDGNHRLLLMGRIGSSAEWKEAGYRSAMQPS